MNVENQVREIISEKLAIDKSKIIPSAELKADLMADSLDEVELIMAFEDEFDLEIPDADAVKIKTVKQAVDYIDAKI